MNPTVAAIKKLSTSPNRILPATESQIIAFGFGLAQGIRNAEASERLSVEEVHDIIQRSFDAFKGVIAFQPAHPDVERLPADPLGRDHVAVFRLHHYFPLPDQPHLEFFFWNDPKEHHVSITRERRENEPAHVVKREALWSLLEQAERALPLLTERSPS